MFKLFSTISEFFHCHHDYKCDLVNILLVPLPKDLKIFSCYGCLCEETFQRLTMIYTHLSHVLLHKS